MSESPQNLRKTYKFKLKPTLAQARLLDSIVWACRRLYNTALEQRITLYKQADALAFNDAPMLYLFFYKDLDAVQPWIRGFQLPSILNGQDMRGVKIEHTGTGR